ncbi:uncharacterized protein LOC131657877 [Vicia villosa]|uniref:uncharacterized protein LOC131657877 n=1 Tax=Vicia villosa TaxID=3911 RepID=UPI00273A77EB|nr:uncharacterized protein LOC131657877 [Vicia villosa]
MGGNNSRLINPNGGDVLPAKIRPLLGQRFEEFRKRRNNVQAEDNELSKKQLLKDNDGGSDGKCSDQNEVSEETQPQKEQQTIIHAVAIDKLSQVVPLPVSECENKEEKKEKKEEGPKGPIDKDVEKTTTEVNIGLSMQEKHDKDEGESKEEEEEEEEDEDEDDGRRIGPGSPSFKIYCVASNKKKEQESHDTHASAEQIPEKEDQNIAVYNKSHSTDDSDESEISESENASNSNDVVKETTPKKKGHNKRKKLEAMKKNLLNVKNIQKNRMNRMMGCAGNDRRSLLEDN